MNLDTLIEILNDYREELGGDAEVRLMTQQNWPFENRICGVTSGQEMNDTDYIDEGDDQDVADERIVYIVEGGPFATAANVLGRRVTLDPTAFVR